MLLFLWKVGGASDLFKMYKLFAKINPRLQRDLYAFALINIGVFVEKELNRFVLEDYKQVSRGPGKLLAFDHIQSAYHCCGANNYTDWQRSSWIQSRSSPNDLPVVCCRSTASMADCNVNNPDMVYKEGCVKFLKARYEMHFLIMGIVAIALPFFQFICFPPHKLSHV
ncbi:Tetraspanin-3 like protein [Argiope bruennichi]|uniref:Tetraspanin-3 like protein n=1 Tax=Argiope bruennichi TaxID=94029 RepID=A0A8T0FDD6_ARGBR|nr:Tetraspanin-3 like protein [Argiope bruennichi]